MNKLLRNSATKLFDHLGYTVIPNWRMDHHSQAEFLKTLFEHCGIDCVFDVGANEGQYGRFLREQVGYKGLIVSFEPIPACVSSLKQCAADDERWLIEEVALGLAPGLARFNVMAGTQFSSFLKPDNSHIQMFTRQNRLAQEIEVKVGTLEDYIPRLLETHSCSSPYLKLDTQGYDLNVARGAGNAITRFRALQTEASVTPIYEGMPGFSDSFREFQKMGFELSGIFPNNPDHFPRMIEFDCHMINRACL